jgi:integrase/recombinase XerD
VRNILWDQKLLYVTGKQGDRAVPVTPGMLRLLKGWLKRHESCKFSDSEYVFITSRSPKMEVDAFGYTLRKHRNKFGLPRITAHTLRHAFCTDYLREGGDIAKLKDITGHTTREQLIDYTHLAKLGSKEAQQELERINAKRGL